MTGQAKYTVDIHYDGLLTGKILGSPHAHARVVQIDTAEAETMPGVKAIVEILDDVHRVARFVGQPILAVAAIDEDTALAAIKKIHIEYEVRPFVTSMEEAMATGR